MDQHQQQLEQWASDQLGDIVMGTPASADASFRRYFRYQLSGRSIIAMDAPPPAEDCRPFVKVAAMLQQAGVAVPEILAADIERGFLLLSDLGVDTYLDVMRREDFAANDADWLFKDAIAVLLQMQQLDAEHQLPLYDEALLRRELQLFPDWYLKRHCQLEISPALQAILDELFDQLIDAVLSQARVFVHRDFMPRNLMLSQPNPGVLDFQDAVFGPISYDPICLFKDAFISWPETKVSEWLQYYWQQAQQTGLPVPDSFAQFQRDCDIMGAHRHLKVIGIFARICHRDGKPHYLADVPRFLQYLHTAAARLPDLPLQPLLQHLRQVSII